MLLVNNLYLCTNRVQFRVKRCFQRVCYSVALGIKRFCSD